MNKILVFGANGQVGKELKKNADKNYIFFDKKKLDITDSDKILKKIKYYKPKFIINLAAFTNVDQSEVKKDLCIKVNYLSVINIVDILKLYKIKLIHISTDYVFDGKKKLYRENDLKNPINFYGLTKSLAEDYIINNLKNYSIIRSSWIYSNDTNSFIKKILNKVEKNDHIFGVIDSYSGPTSTKNLTKAIDFVVKNKLKKKIFHFCDGYRISPYNFIIKILNVLNIKKYKVKKIQYRNLKLLAKRPQISYLGISKDFKKIKLLTLDEQIKSYIL